MEQIRNILYNKIVLEIVSRLTIGREDEDLRAFTRDECEFYIDQYNNRIMNIINEIIVDYEFDQDCDTSSDPHTICSGMENDWIREYMGELGYP